MYRKKWATLGSGTLMAWTIEKRGPQGKNLNFVHHILHASQNSFLVNSNDFSFHFLHHHLPLHTMLFPFLPRKWSSLPFSHVIISSNHLPNK